MKNRNVKLTKSVNRKSKTTTYYKYIISIPKGIADDLEWDEKTNLTMRLEPKNDPVRLVLEKD